MATLHLSLRLEARPSARREFAQALLGWAAAVRREPGTVRAHVSENLEAPAMFELDAEWASLEALEDHARSEACGILLGAVEVLARPVAATFSRTTDELGADGLAALHRLRETARPHIAARLHDSKR